jgi:predicted PurR-regulated permease PerM
MRLPVGTRRNALQEDPVSDPSSHPPSDRILDVSVDVALRLALVAFLVLMCVVIVRPFAILILWAIILAVALAGPFEKLAGLLGRRGWAATVLSLAGVALIALPSYFMGTSLVSTVRNLQESLEAGTLEAPPANEAVQGIPVVGERIYEAWELAHDDIQQAVEQFEPQLRDAGEWAVGFLTGVGGAALQTLVALIIASVFLTYRDGAVGNAKRLARRIAPQGGDDYVTMAGATINSVTQGVLGVAAIQAVLTGILLAFVNMPFAPVWALAMFVIATLQLPGLILMIFPIIWSFSHLSGVGLIVFIVLAVVVGAIDTPLKAVLLGRGLPIPTYIILIGAIGGMVSMGMMGLFVGAVILGLGYRLFTLWVDESTSVEDVVQAAEAMEAEGA